MRHDIDNTNYLVPIRDAKLEMGLDGGQGASAG
jgi:hypothetical protein